MRVVVALMLVAPLVTALWIWLQARGQGVPWHRYREIACVSLPRNAPEALTLSVAGFCGIVGAALLAGRPLPLVDALAGLSATGLYVVLPLLITLGSNLAMPPIFVVTFLGSVLVENPHFSADPTLLGLSLTLGWVLNLTASPFSATSLVLARATGIAGTTLAWRWNALFSLGAYCIIAVALSLLA